MNNTEIKNLKAVNTILGKLEIRQVKTNCPLHGEYLLSIKPKTSQPSFKRQTAKRPLSNWQDVLLKAGRRQKQADMDFCFWEAAGLGRHILPAQS